MKLNFRQSLFIILTIITLLACSVLNIEQTAPDGEQTAPDAEQASPDVEQAAPDAEQTAPDVEQIAPEPGWLLEYTAYIQGKMDERNIPGLALAVVQGDDIILAEGYGLRDITSGEPVTPGTLFHIGSTHKSITSMLIATLVDDGLIDWDTPVVQVAPVFELADPGATQQVTIRHLLSMRSGIPDEAEDDLDLDYAAPEDVFAVISQTPLLGQPGETFSYSNLSGAVSGYIGVLAAGGDFDDLYEDYAALLQERVLDPIGMQTATIYASEAQSSPNYSRSYTLSAKGEPVFSESYDFDGDVLAPAGSLKANVLEMALFISTQMNGGIAPNGTRVVSDDSLAETWQPYLENYALGWEVQEYQGTQMIFHSGSYDEFASVIGFMPDLGIGFVILLNCDEAGNDLVDEAPYRLVEILARR